jgi:DNA-binding NtrC family response regulator
MDDSSVPIRVLLVDDEEEFLASVTKPLGRRGFEVTTAPDGSRALELIGTRKFDVVVLDVKMPGLSGDQVFREIKKLRPGLPVIMLTGHGTIQQAFQTSKEGVFEYLAKPCEVEALTEVLRRATRDIRSQGADDPALSEAERIRVMLVDDEEDLLESLSKALVRRGMAVETAPDGEKALGKAEGNVFDVVVLDMKMPGMGGMATLLRFKENYPLTEVILLTGHPSSPQAVEAMRRGAFDFLMKPVDIAELVRCIHEAAAKRAGRVNEERARRIEELSRRNPG